MAVRIRKDVWKLAEWDPILLWYAKAVADMQTRPLNDPTSWRYQAAIHDYDPDDDPLSSPGDNPPSQADQKRFWRQCQHFSWFFLSWHRMYLSFFEQIIIEIVNRLGGPADWALPYWNYSDTNNPNARKLPPAFRRNSLPDGSPNALRVDERVIGANDGDKVGSANAVN
jgi:tyrosinase